MKEYAVVQIKPANYVHSQTFDPIAKLLHASLCSLGKKSKIYTNQLFEDKTNIIIGYNLLSPDMISTLDRFRCVIYQLEQLSDKEGWYKPRTAQALKAAECVWDYSLENIQFLRSYGIESVKHLPLGYHQALEVVKQSPKKDIDVLFYGSLNSRRSAIIERLRRECHTEVLFGVYGEILDSYIARAKIVLNMHFYSSKVMEQVRISYLLNNRCFIVSEESESNPYGQSIVTANYDDLVETCLRYLNDEQGRNEYVEAGYRFLRKNLMEENLKKVLEQDGM